MIDRLITKIKTAIIKWLGIDKEVSRLESRIVTLSKVIKRAESEIIKRTDISVDPSVHKNGFNYVFVSGRYKGNDYVRLFQIPGIEMPELVDHLRYIEKEEYGKVKTVDHSFNGVSEIIKREVRR